MRKRNILVNVICGLIAVSGVLFLAWIFYIAATGQYEPTRWGMDHGDPVGFSAVDKQFKLDEFGDLPLPTAVTYNRDSNTVTLYLDKPATAQETAKIGNYFKLLLTTPKRDLWVNLGYGEAGIASRAIAENGLGNELIAADFLMKTLNQYYLAQPEFLTEVSAFCERIYARSDFNPAYMASIRILSDKVVLTVHNDSARIKTASLSVLQYLGDKDGQNEIYHRFKDDYLFLMNKFIGKKVEKQVNENRSFACLRQIHRCLILADWLKTENPLIGSTQRYSNIDANVSVCCDIKRKYDEMYTKTLFKTERVSHNKYGQRRIEIMNRGGGVNFNKMKRPTIEEGEVVRDKDSIDIDLSAPATSDTGEHLWTRYSDGKSVSVWHKFLQLIGVEKQIGFDRPEETGGVEF